MEGLIKCRKNKEGVPEIKRPLIVFNINPNNN
jgi:hypothetical protein